MEFCYKFRIWKTEYKFVKHTAQKYNLKIDRQTRYYLNLALIPHISQNGS